MSSIEWRFKRNHKPLSNKSCRSSSKWWFKENHKPITLACCCSTDGTSKLEARLSIVDVVPPGQGQGKKAKIYPLQDLSILESEFVGMTDISS
jgi:hypothetical protein